jgi:hypothetical protein
MRKAWLTAGALAVLLGAVFVSIGVWQFLADTGKNILSPQVLIWIGLHVVAALLSLICFKLASPEVDSAEQKRSV